MKIYWLLFLLSLTVGTNLLAQNNLIYSRQQGSGNVISIDQSTGLITTISATNSNSFLNSNYCINSDSMWYIFGYSSGSNFTLEVIDINSKTIKYSSTTSTTLAFSKLDYNPNDNMVYALSSHDLYKINPRNGSTALVTSFSGSAINLATTIDPIKNIYYLYSNGLDGINLNTGNSITPVSLSAGSIFHLFYNCTNQSLMYFASGNVGIINPATGAISNQIALGISGYLSGTACSDNQHGLFYFSSGGNLVSVNTNNGSVTSIPFSGNCRAFVCVNSCNFLIADAGKNLSICKAGSPQVLAANFPTGGSGKYHYKWQPSSLLNNDTILNPTATCFSNTKFFLTVYDSVTQSVNTDSVFVSILPTINKTISKNICTGNSIFFNGNSLTLSGTYLDTLVSHSGCDSFITLHLFVNNLTSNKDSFANACESFFFKNKLLDSSGLYYDTLQNYLGCDSFVTLHLSIDTIPQAAFYLIQDQAAQHHWFLINLSVGSSLQYIWNWGDNTSDSFVTYPQHIYQNDGYYTICLTALDSVSGCYSTFCDTAATFYTRVNSQNSIISISVIDTVPVFKIPTVLSTIKNISFFPSPTENILNFKPKNITITHFEVYGATGKLCLKIIENTSADGFINLSLLQAGLYLIVTQDSEGQLYFNRFSKL
jgi:PKD domain